MSDTIMDQQFLQRIIDAVEQARDVVTRFEHVNQIVQRLERIVRDGNGEPSLMRQMIALQQRVSMLESEQARALQQRAERDRGSLTVRAHMVHGLAAAVVGAIVSALTVYLSK